MNGLCCVLLRSYPKDGGGGQVLFHLLRWSKYTGISLSHYKQEFMVSYIFNGIFHLRLL